MLWYLIILLGAGLDQLTKYCITSNLSLGEVAPFLGDFMHFKYILNTGASFSMLSGRRVFLITLTVIVLIAVVILHHRLDKAERWTHICLAVFTGGVLGNLIDRVRIGAVVDFFYTTWFPTFNVADCLIDVSMVAIICMLLFGKLGKKLEGKK